ncbi:hypothetical protein ABXJ76_07825 [Methylobacter sp. G7]
MDKAIKLLKVKLKKSHTHAGIEYQPGAEIEITETQAKVLTDQGII